MGAADWAEALEPLLAVQPATADDIHLWLRLLPLLQTLLSTHRLQSAQLQWLALKVKMAALPLLGSPEAGAAAPTLPLTLSDHPAARTFEGVLEALDRLRLISVRLLWVHPSAANTRTRGRAAFTQWHVKEPLLCQWAQHHAVCSQAVVVV